MALYQVFIQNCTVYSGTAFLKYYLFTITNIKLYITEEQKKLIEGIDIAEIGIVSSFNFITSKIPDKAFTIDTINHVGVVIDKAEGEKCARCWKVLPEVKGKEICCRCKNVIN